MDNRTAHKKPASKVDITGGPLWRGIIVFALPLIAAGMLQQSFNTVDVAVVAHWTGPDALAAVGSNAPVISLIVNLFAGLAVGANVVISQYVGSRDADKVRRSVATASVIALTSGVVLTVAGMTLTRPILVAIDTPASILDPAALYLRIYFTGMPGLMVFNFGSAVLRSMGDTRRPFYALAAGGVLNLALDLLFVVVMGMGVEGVAIATALAMTLSGAIVTVILMREREPFRVSRASLRPYGRQLRKILAIGVPAGLQGVVFSLSNVFILSNINKFGAIAATASASAINFEYYCYFIISAFTQAAVAFTGANYGAGNMERCRRVFRICLILSAAGCGVANGLLVIFSKQALSIFTVDPAVVGYATTRMVYVLLWQWLASSYEISGAAMRGMGYSMTPMLLTVLGTCVVRIAWVHTVTADATDWSLLMSVYPVTWILTGAAVTGAYFIVMRRVACAHTRA